MSPGEWKGENVLIRNGVLILGESHYGHTEDTIGKGIEPEYKTSEVVEEYLRHRSQYDGSAKWDRFFDNIAASFGYTKEECGDFYNKVWFGNYVPVLCGIGETNTAKSFMKKCRTDYNNQLFSFINDNEISTVVCFSKSSYWNLPDSNSVDTCIDIEIPSTDGKRNVIHKYQYVSGIERNGCEVILEKPLLVYGIKHPSSRSGYNPRDVYDVFIKEKELSYICKK